MDGTIVTCYCLCDDLLQALHHHNDPQCQLSDAEILTIAIVAARFFSGNHALALIFMAEQGYVPVQLSESRFNRRLYRVSDDGAIQLFDAIDGTLPRLKRVWADQRYAGQLVEWVQHFFAFVLDIVRRPKQQRGFVLLPKRWIVERTLGWFNRYRRLSKDYERRTDVSEGMVYLASIRRMLRWLDRYHKPT